MRPVSVVVPTIGRDSLYRTLDSLIVQTEPCDEVLVVSDGPADQELRELERTLRRVPGRYRMIELPARANDWGHTPRNVGFAQARGELLWSIDDDDVAAPGALDAVRSARTGELTIFRMASSAGWTLWGREEIAVGNVGTPMCVVPWGQHAAWGSRYEGDFDFAHDTAERLPVVWRSETVALIRPSG